MMFGQQKRSLEITVSSQPMKYQKHFGDSSSDANARVASLTDDELQFQQPFAGVGQKHVPPVSPGARCDSLKVVENAFASELRMPLRSKVSLRLKNNMELIPRECAIFSNEYQVVKGADNLCAQTIKEAKIDSHEGDISLSFEESIETEWNSYLLVNCLMRDETDPCLRGLPASLNKMSRNSRGHFESTLNQPESFLLAGDEQIGLDPGAPFRNSPSTKNDSSEGGTLSKAEDSYGSRPLPVLLNEKVIDLRLMHEQVASLGGYQIVTSDRLWSNISVSLGVGPDCGPGLKLICFKCLRSSEGKLLEDYCDAGLLGSMRTRVTALSNEKRLADKKDENCSPTGGAQFAESEPSHGKVMNIGSYSGRKDGHKEGDPFGHGTQRGLFMKKKELAQVQVKWRTDSEQGRRKMQSDSAFLDNCSFSHWCDDSPVGNHSDTTLLKAHCNCVATGIVKQGNILDTQGEPISEKDHMSLVDTLIWIKRMAVEPGNLYMGQGAEETSQTEDWAKKCAFQAVKVRVLLWKRRDGITPSDAHSHKGKQILAPSLYYSVPQIEQQSLERPRTSRERVAHYGFPMVKASDGSVNLKRVSSSSLTQMQWAGRTRSRLPKKCHFYDEKRFREEKFIDRPHKQVPIGPDFQAHIPVWGSVDCWNSVGGSERAWPTGDETQSSDDEGEDMSRWLGKLVWPPPGSERVADKDQVGQGRPSCCSCLNPQALDCIRLHILEARDRLRQELDQAFYVWKFDQMGEGVAYQWTREEAQMFSALVKMNPPSRDKNFWDQLPEAFPGKMMKDLVSYYFNVFMLRRRAAQNRLCPEHVDSDDDEMVLSEGGSADSEDYESGEELDADMDEDGSDGDDEIVRQTGLYGDCSSAELVEDRLFSDTAGVNLIYPSKMDIVSTEEDSEGVPIPSGITALMSPQQEERGVKLCTSHVTAKWSHLDHDYEKHLKQNNLCIAGEEVLQEVETWEASHWDESGDENLVDDPSVEGTSFKVEQSSTISTDKNPSAYEKVVDGTNQHTSLGSSCEAEVWAPILDIAPRRAKDKLLSTKGMIQEFFGSHF